MKELSEGKRGRGEKNKRVFLFGIQLSEIVSEKGCHNFSLLLSHIIISPSVTGLVFG